MRRIASQCVAVISLLALVFVTADGRTRPRYGGTLRIETRDEALRSPDGVARKLLFNTLTQVNEDGVVAPALAASWSAESANHRWQFHLRPGVRFHDGSPLTAEAVVQSLAQACGNCGWRARATGDSVVITSESPMPGLPAELARSEYAIVRQDGDGNPVGTGPFRFAAHSNGIVFLSANDDSWQGRPFPDAVEIYEDRSIRAQWMDFSIGKADLVEAPPELLRTAEQDHMPLMSSARPVDLLALTVSDQRVRDEHLRDSIALAVDRAALLNVIFQKQGEVSASLLPSALSGYSFLFPTAADLPRARELRGGQALPLRLEVDNSNALLQLVAERLALNLRDAGWNVQVVSQAANQHADLILRLAHLEAADASPALREMMQAFGAAYNDEATDPASLYRAEQTFLQSHKVVPLLYLSRAYGIGTRVHNLSLSPEGTPLIAGASLEEAR